MTYPPLTATTIHDVQKDCPENITIGWSTPSSTLEQCARPAGPPYGNFDIKDSDSVFRSDQPPVKHWPLESQYVAHFTPSRMFMVAFDILMASTPIMFISTLFSVLMHQCQADN
jgi:hypothetical protein